MKLQLKVTLFGAAGNGKSSIGNMLLSGNISGPFPVVDTPRGLNVDGHIMHASSERYMVYDMSGVGEISSSNNPHEEVAESIKNYFSRKRTPLNFICYVVKEGRSKLAGVQSTFSLFKKIFKGGEKNFVIIITDSSQEWVDRCRNELVNDFGNYPMIGVDFPFHKKFDDRIQEELRKRSINHLNTQLLNLRHACTEFQINNTFETREEYFAETVAQVPVLGNAYRLLSSGAYYVAGRADMSKERLPEGPIKGVAKLVFDVGYTAIIICGNTCAIIE
ncbi:5887_t:CDS:2 [Diversispora eburnea]|uniref:5887_t:CDS:1 n=1 Tax=Diversispora eburnea TaxID=1213867 RepID=A0A9N9CDK4_9GLOM|nr:5887_t:CDS:2 [Diversispora eburnea]